MTDAIVWFKTLPPKLRERALFFRWLHRQGRLEPRSLAAERVAVVVGDPGDCDPSGDSFDPASAGSA